MAHKGQGFLGVGQTLVYIPNIALTYYLTFTYDLWDYPQTKLLDTVCFGQKIMFPS